MPHHLQNIPPLLLLTITLLTITLILALIVPHLTTPAPQEHYTTSACYSLSTQPGFSCTTAQRQRVCHMFNAQTGDSNIKCDYNTPRQCDNHQHILNKNNVKHLRGYSGQTKTDVARIHSKMGQSRVRHCQLGDRLKSRTYGHHEALHTLNNKPYLSNASFRSVTSPAADTPAGIAQRKQDTTRAQELHRAVRS